MKTETRLADLARLRRAVRPLLTIAITLTKETLTMNRNWIPVAGTAAAIVAVAVCNMPVETKPQPVPAGLEQFGPLDYSYEIVGDTFIIHAKGSISYNEAVAFNQFRKTWENVPLGNVKRVALSLDSYGGSIVGAADMAEWVRANKV